MHWFQAADSAAEYWDDQALNEVLTNSCDDTSESIDWHFPQPPSREVQKWKWTPEEDTLLSRLARQFNQDWSKVSEFFPNKTLSNIKKRYLNKHNPVIRKSSWTPQEDRVILSLYAEQGCSWMQIAEHLPGRQPDAIKNRFYGTLRKKLSLHDQTRLTRRPKISEWGIKDGASLSLFNEEDLRQMTSEEKLQRINELCIKVDSLESFLGEAKEHISRLKTLLDQ